MVSIFQLKHTQLCQVIILSCFLSCAMCNGCACSSTYCELIFLLLDFIYMVNFMCFSGLAQNITAHLLYDALRRTCGKLKTESFSVSKWEHMLGQKTWLFLCKLKNIPKGQRRLGFQNRLFPLWLSLMAKDTAISAFCIRRKESNECLVETDMESKCSK